MGEVDSMVLGRHFMAHLIANHKAELQLGRGDQANIQEVVTALLAQYEDLEYSEIDPTNPEPEVAEVLSQYSDMQLVEESKAVLTYGLIDDHKFVEFITRTYIPEDLLFNPRQKMFQVLPRKSLEEGMSGQAMLGIDAERTDCALCMQRVDLGSEVLQVPCEHWFHPECFENWLQICQRCPVCRLEVGPAE